MPAPSGSKVSRVDDADRDARQRLADVPAPRAGLEEARRAEVEGADRDHRGALGHAVALQRADAERVLERLGERLGELLRAGHDQPQRAELRRRAASQIELEEGRRRQQDRRRGSAATSSPIVAASSGLGWKTIPIPVLIASHEMTYSRTSGTAAGCRAAGRPAGRGRPADRLDVAVDVEVGEDHPLRLARAAAAEDDRRGVVDRHRPSGAGEPLEPAGPARSQAHRRRDRSIGHADPGARRPPARSAPRPRAARAWPSRGRSGW